MEVLGGIQGQSPGRTVGGLGPSETENDVQKIRDVLYAFTGQLIGLVIIRRGHGGIAPLDSRRGIARLLPPL